MIKRLLRKLSLPDHYGHPGDSRAVDLSERRKLQAKLINERAMKHDNDIRIARIEGMVRLIKLTEMRPVD